MFERIIERGTLVTVVVLIIAILGIAAATRIPVQMIPDLDVRTIGVRTQWPGATPQDVEKEILIEQEKYLRNLPNLTRITASASTGSATIELEFPLGVDVTQMMIRVNNALSQVPSYPENVDEPQIFASSFSSNSFMFFSVQPLPGNPRGVDSHLLFKHLSRHRGQQPGSVGADQFHLYSLIVARSEIDLGGPLKMTQSTGQWFLDRHRSQGLL